MIPTEQKATLSRCVFPCSHDPRTVSLRNSTGRTVMKNTSHVVCPWNVGQTHLVLPCQYIFETPWLLFTIPTTHSHMSNNTVHVSCHLRQIPNNKAVVELSCELHESIREGIQITFQSEICCNFLGAVIVMAFSFLVAALLCCWGRLHMRHCDVSASHQSVVAPGAIERQERKGKGEGGTHEKERGTRKEGEMR